MDRFNEEEKLSLPQWISAESWEDLSSGLCGQGVNGRFATVFCNRWLRRAWLIALALMGMEGSWHSKVFTDTKFKGSTHTNCKKIRSSPCMGIDVGDWSKRCVDYWSSILMNAKQAHCVESLRKWILMTCCMLHRETNKGYGFTKPFKDERT